MHLGWSPLLSLTQPSSEAGRLLLTPSLCPKPQEVGVRRGQEQVQLRRKRAVCVCVCVCARAHVCVYVCEVAKLSWPGRAGSDIYPESLPTSLGPSCHLFRVLLSWLLGQLPVGNDQQVSGVECIPTPT